MNNIDEILYIGKVVSVKGKYIDIIVDKTKNSSHLLFEGEIIRNVSVGSYVKICKGFERLVGIIEGEYITEDKSILDKSNKNDKNKIKRILNVSLVGYFGIDKFEHGIKELPLIDNDCYILTNVEFDQVHNFIRIIDGKPDDRIEIANLSNETSKRIAIGVNSLFASHIGIFGNTGSGKSYTLASLYHKLFEKYGNRKGFKKNARFLIIDFNGEYIDESKNETKDSTITHSNKIIFKLSTGKEGSIKKLNISKETIYNPAFWAIVLQATEKTQAPFIDGALKNEYLKDGFKSKEEIKERIKNTLKLIMINITQNQEKNLVEVFLDEMQKFKCDEVIKGLDSLKKFYLENLVFFTSKDTRDYRCTIGESSYYSNKSEDFYENVISKQVDDLVNINLTKLTELQKIKLTINFHFFYSIQKGYYRKDHIGHILGRLENRLKDMSKLINISKEPFLNQAMTIISLKNVNIHMRKLIPLIICNQVYEEKKKENNPEKYLNLIIDEAHNILSYDSVRENETWKDYRLETFEEIIKEGRKFGVFLTIASQRPHDISATIISQLHNYFLHRLINNKDIEAIEKTVSYLDKVSFDKLSILPVGSCILAGLSAQIPVIINMDKIEDEYEPHNKTIKPTDFWD